MNFKRRKFIQNLGAVLGAQLFNVSFAMEEGFLEPHFFIAIVINGGMDVTLGLEPQTHRNWKTDEFDIFLEYRPEEILKKGNINLGPAASSLLKYYEDICIVNGVGMKRDNGHIRVRDYLFSGDKKEKSAFLPIELEVNKRKKSPAGVLANFSPIFGSRLSILSSINNLKNSTPISSEVNAILNGFQQKDALSFSVNSLNKIEKSRPLFEKAIERMISKGYERNSLSTIAASFESGIANYCALDLNMLANQNEISSLTSFDLDTHSNHVIAHLNSQKRVWESVSYIFDLFKSIELNGKTLFDLTTFMIGSEFSRTPFLNGAKGKDHNSLTNSVLFAGKNIQGNKTIGASKVIRRQNSKTGVSQHEAMKYDFKERKVVKQVNFEDERENIQIIHPENLVQTVGHIFGCSSENFYPSNQNLVLHDLIKS